MSETVTAMACGNCKEPLDESDSLPISERQPCPKCGSKARSFHHEIFTTQSNRVSLKLRHKRPGAEGWLTQLFFGWELRKSVGDFVQKLRRIDRPNDLYIEHVETKDGTVLHDVDEPLSSHRSHGSDRPL